ncbi:unnamed protein product [Arctogadus glacialis]
MGNSGVEGDRLSISRVWCQAPREKWILGFNFQIYLVHFEGEPRGGPDKHTSIPHVIFRGNHLLLDFILSLWGGSEEIRMGLGCDQGWAQRRPALGLRGDLRLGSGGTCVGAQGRAALGLRGDLRLGSGETCVGAQGRPALGLRGDLRLGSGGTCVCPPESGRPLGNTG